MAQANRLPLIERIGNLSCMSGIHRDYRTYPDFTSVKGAEDTAAHIERENSRIYGKVLGFWSPGGKRFESILVLTTIVQKSCGSESRRLHR